MVAKITSGPTSTAAGLDALESATRGAQSAAATESAQAAAATVDPMTRIAERLMTGEIGRDQAVELVLAEVLGAPSVQGVPAELKTEIASALEALIETDPYLSSLVAALGPKETGQ